MKWSITASGTDDVSLFAGALTNSSIAQIYGGGQGSALVALGEDGCSVGCAAWMQGNGVCDAACDTVACGRDVGDCSPTASTARSADVAFDADFSTEPGTAGFAFVDEGELRVEQCGSTRVLGGRGVFGRRATAAAQFTPAATTPSGAPWAQCFG